MFIVFIYSPGTHHRVRLHLVGKLETSNLDHKRHRAAIGLGGHLVLEKVHLANSNL